MKRIITEVKVYKGEKVGRDAGGTYVDYDCFEVHKLTDFQFNQAVDKGLNPIILIDKIAENEKTGYRVTFANGTDKIFFNVAEITSKLIKE